MTCLCVGLHVVAHLVMSQRLLSVSIDKLELVPSSSFFFFVVFCLFFFFVAVAVDFFFFVFNCG